MAGFQPISTITGAPWNGQARQYLISSTLTGAYPLNGGDPVCMTQSGGIAPATITGTALLAVGQLIGVFVSCSYKLLGQQLVTNSTYFPGPGTSVYDPSYPPVANIIDDPNVLYSLQCSAAGITLSNLGNTVNYSLPAAPGIATGYSGALLDSSTFNTISTQYLRIIGLADNSITTTDATGASYSVPNSFGVAGNNALVKFNVHAYQSVGTPGV